MMIILSAKAPTEVEHSLAPASLCLSAAILVPWLVLRSPQQSLHLQSLNGPMS